MISSWRKNVRIYTIHLYYSEIEGKRSQKPIGDVDVESEQFHPTFRERHMTSRRLMVLR
jgi:hypothetical protein